MILESLLELVETLKARIDTHGDQLRKSEALTRYALIDPLLRELGWDTEDPNRSLVRPRVPISAICSPEVAHRFFALCVTGRLGYTRRNNSLPDDGGGQEAGNTTTRFGPSAKGHIN